VASNAGSADFQWRDLHVFADGVEAHYYLRIGMADNQNIWTGPVYVTYDASSPVAVGDPPSGGNGVRLTARPNPTRGMLTAEFTLPRAESRASLAVFDLSGRLQRTLLDRPLDAGSHRVTWDGLTGGGTRPAPGIFFLRLEAGALRLEQKVLLLR